jgi:hypothetical protein
MNTRNKCVEMNAETSLNHDISDDRHFTNREETSKDTFVAIMSSREYTELHQLETRRGDRCYVLAMFVNFKLDLQHPYLAMKASDGPGFDIDTEHQYRYRVHAVEALANPVSAGSSASSCCQCASSWLSFPSAFRENAHEHFVYSLLRVIYVLPDNALTVP